MSDHQWIGKQIATELKVSYEMKLSHSRTAAKLELKNKAAEMESTFHRQLEDRVKDAAGESGGSPCGGPQADRGDDDRDEYAQAQIHRDRKRACADAPWKMTAARVCPIYCLLLARFSFYSLHFFDRRR